MMNITPQNFNMPIQTSVNVQTDSLRRDNNQKEVVTKPEAVHHVVAEKVVASDKERSKTPSQNNENIDFFSLRKQGQLSENEVNGQQGDSQNSSQQNAEQGKDEPEQSNSVVNDNILSTNENDPQELTLKEKQIVKELEVRDKEVRRHEIAHASIGGALTAPPTYTYEVGPDGKKYAISGEVSIDVSPIEGDPRATIAKMKKVQASALAPVHPSPQDLRVAATAEKEIIQAQAQLAENNQSLSNSPYGITSDILPKNGEQSFQQSNDVDQFIETTPSTQKNITFTESISISERAQRVKNFYAMINQAYEKSANHQFELIA